MMLADLIKATITFVMSNYSVSFFVIGLVVSLGVVARAGAFTDWSLVVEKLPSHARAQLLGEAFSLVVSRTPRTHYEEARLGA